MSSTLPCHVDQLYVSIGQWCLAMLVLWAVLLLLQRHWDTMPPRRAGKLIPHAENLGSMGERGWWSVLLPSSSLLDGLYHEAVLLMQDILRQSNKTKQLVMMKQAVAGSVPSLPSLPHFCLFFFFSPGPSGLCSHVKQQHISMCHRLSILGKPG